MRDSFGGVFMIRLILVFIFIFVSFTAVSLNYAKSFRVKNRVIDFIEQNEMISFDETLFEEKLEPILKSSSYNQACPNGEGLIKNPEGKDEGYCYKGITITKTPQEEEIEGTTSKRIFYQVTTYANWNLGILNKILVLGGKKEDSESYVNGQWAINGTATVITSQ